MYDLLSQGRITSGYGYRTAPVKGASTNHMAIDIVLKNDNVPSITSGTVEYVGYSSGGGNMIYIRNDDGTLAKYMHLAAPSSLKKGQKVGEGQIIGTQGATGNVTGKHLHLAIVGTDGKTINPVTYLGGAEGTYTYGSTTGGSNNGSIKDALLNILSKLVLFIVIVLIVVLAAYLFIKAFNIQIF